MKDQKKILLIDDEEDFCFFLQRNLEKTGEFKVLTAFNGTDGINLAREAKPDAILLDIVMPKLDGTDVAEILINDPKTRHIPLIFLTACVTDEEIGIEPTREIGGHHFIAKTVDSEKLINTIKIILKEFSKV